MPTNHSQDIQEPGSNSADPLKRLRALGIRYPVMQAGMSSASGPQLAGAVAAAGGIGTLGLHDVSVWKSAIEQTRCLAGQQPYAVNLLLPYTRRRHIDTVIRERVPIATLFWGDGRAIIRQLKREGIFVFQQVGSQCEAKQALDAGVDGLIVQGSEAGGHVRAQERLSELLPEIATSATDIPVFAAGGICTAEDARNAIRVGAQGVCCGTRFLLTPESHIHEAYRQRLLAADETIVTRLFGFGWPDPHRVIPNKATEHWCNEKGETPAALQWVNAAFAFTRKLLPTKSGIAAIQHPKLPFFSPVPLEPGLRPGLVEATALYAGEQIYRIENVQPAASIVNDLATGIAAAVES